MSAKIRTLEEIGINALPALEEMRLDGWLVRFANGHTGRANSVYPFESSVRDIGEKIAECERLYAARSIPCLFKMTAAADPSELDEVLQRRGYTAFNHSIVQCANLRGGAFPPPPAPYSPSLTASDHPTEQWLSAFATLRNLLAHHATTFRAMLAKLSLPSRYILMMQDDTPLTCGLAVVEDQYAGLFDITTHPSHRRRGIAIRLVHALLDWARTTGATTAYLQVMASNAPALSLYEKFGFKEEYRYWYRRQPM